MVNEKLEIALTEKNPNFLEVVDQKVELALKNQANSFSSKEEDFEIRMEQ